MGQLLVRLAESTRKLLWSLAACTAMSVCHVSHADYVSLTGAETAANIAEIEIGRDSLKLTLEISAAEAGKFWPGINVTEDLSTLAEMAAANNNLQFLLYSSDKPLQPSRYVVSVAERKERKSPFAGMTDPRTGQKLPDFPEDRLILQVQADYPVVNTDRIALQPPLDSGGIANTNIGFVTRHGATVVNNFSYLSEPETLLIDWTDPWNTRYDNPNLRRHSPFPVMSFLYIEPRLVRHDVLLRSRKLAEWTGRPFDAWEPLTQSIRQELATAAGEYLRKRNPASIDGRPSNPESTEIVFLKATETGFSLIPDTQRVEMGSTLIGYRESYAVEHLPTNFRVRWRLFDENLSIVPTLIQDPVGPFPTHTTTAFPTITWQNFLKQYEEPNSAPVPVRMQHLYVPSLLPLTVLIIVLMIFLSRHYPSTWVRFQRSLASSGAGLALIITGFILLPARFAMPVPGPTDNQQLAGVTRDLLTQVAIAYLERDERRINMALSDLVLPETFTGTVNNLASIYQPLTTVGGKGQVTAISELELQYVERLDVDGASTFRAIGNWQATVEGHYWGHSDRRQYQIRADLEISQDEGHWKIAAFTPLKFTDRRASMTDQAGNRGSP